MRHSVRLTFALWFAFILSTVSISGSAAPVPVVDLQSEVRGTVYETIDADQTRAEEIFAAAEAAVYFPSLRRVRSLVSTGAATALGKTTAVGTRTHREFTDEIERDFPRFRSNAHGAYLLKQPAMMTGNAKPIAETESVPAAPLASVFTDSFESGMTNWSLDNNTLDLYSWGATTCAARTGTHSADALRGGVNNLTCTDAYAPNVTTTMMHKNCEAIQGASQAWLDSYILLATESGGDTLGFYYAGADGLGYGYEFSGTASVWFHVVFNLKQWYRIGDLTTSSCSALAVQFRSNATTQPGFGARIDDLTIGNGAPGFLTASITAMPSSGTVPLTVNFTPAVAGATSAATYQWSFGDAAITTATTPAASFTYTTPGDYWARLRVDDASTGVRAYAHTLIHATSASICSVTCTATAPATVAAGSSALFQATATATGCSGTASYSWTFGDGQSSTQQNASHIYAAAGTYNWTLTTSISGTSCTKSGTITVTEAGRPRMRAVSRTTPPIASGSIGVAGGSLSGGGLTLTVPAGAFTSTSTIVFRKLTTGVREEGVVSEMYGITGLPSKVSGALTLEIDVSGSSLSAEEKYYISASAGMYVKSNPADRQEVTRMIPVAATQSGTRVSVTLPANWPMPGATRFFTPAIESLAAQPMDVGDRELRVKAEKLTSVETTHFSARVFPRNRSTALTVLNLLETHHQRLIDLGFSFDCRNDGATYRKITVVPYAMGTGEGDLGSHISGGDPCGTNWVFSSDYLEISTSVPATDARLGGAAAHELFHLVQDMYSPGGARANLWLKEASSIWLENTLGLCPDVQNTYTMFAWNGLFNSRNSAVPAFWTSDREGRHGYGASYFLKYRTDNGTGAKDRLLINLWTQIRNGSSELAAMQSALGVPSLADYWTQFAKAYFAPLQSAACFPSAANFDRETIADEKALPRTYSFDGYPLSARSWLLDISKFKSDAAQPVTIRSFGLKYGQSIYIYDRKAATELATLTADNVKYDIADLRNLSGTFLIAWFIDTNLPPANANNVSSTNVVALSIGDETKLDKFPWSHLTQWNDAVVGAAAVWTSASSGVVEAPKGSTVTIDTSLPNLPQLKIRAHTAIGRVVVSGAYLVTINPMSGRKTNADGSYMDFAFSNPRFSVDRGGTSSGANFRYEIPAEDNQAGLAQTYQFDFTKTCYDKQGKQYDCSFTVGEGTFMLIDFERNE